MVSKQTFVYIFLLTLVSCQTLKGPQAPFFEGSAQIKEYNKKESFKVEIYKREKIFRIDILSHWGQLFLTYLWNSKEHLLLFPYYKKYYKSKKPPLETLSEWSALINNPHLLLQILNQNMDSHWVCKQVPHKRCRFKDIQVDWVKNKISFKVKKDHQEFTLHLTQKSIPIKIIEKLFRIQVPKSFQKVNKISLKIK